MSTCIVAGNAACLHDDLDMAYGKYGYVPIIAVNGASAEVKAIALFSQHPERFTELRWASKQSKFGNNFTLNAPGEGNLPSVTYWPDIPKGGGSAWGARKLAVKLGFDLVILCGCPLVPGPYVGGHNLYGFMHREEIVDDLFEQIRKDTAWHRGCISMSGRTKELLC